jgi:hypothetical protein
MHFSRYKLSSSRISWDAQAEHAIGKSKKLLSASKFLRKYLTESQFLKAAAANYYGSVFYACSLWYQNLKHDSKTKLTSIHFRCAKKDYMMKFKRDQLTAECQRATPDQWTRFITASRIIKVMRDQKPVGLFNALEQCYFEEKRKPGIGLFFDSSRTKKGRQSIQNRLLFMRSMNHPWNDPSNPMTNDQIRIVMKRTFFPYLQVQVTVPIQTFTNLNCSFFNMSTSA